MEKCKHCGSSNLYLEPRVEGQDVLTANQVALKCSNCGKWLKWCPKDERKKYLKDNQLDIEKNKDAALCYYEINRQELENKIKELEQKLLEKEEQITEYINMLWQREWASKYNEMRRKEQPGLLFPDSDEVYEKYFEQKERIAILENKLEEIKKVFGDKQ